MSSTLPLTTFEEFLLWEDRPAYPWNCFVRLRFSGRLDRAALEAALPKVIERHPLLRSKLQTQGARSQWQPLEGALPDVEWIEGQTGGDYPPATLLDLREQIGSKLYVLRDQQSTDLVFQWHHACCDGAGGFVFLNDLLIAYALEQGASGKRLSPPQFDPQRIHQRGTYGLTAWKLLKLIPRQMIGLQGARQFMTRSPAPLLPHEVRPNDDPLPAGYPATRVHTFTAEETAALRGVAKSLGVTVNDLLTRDLFLALGAWRNRQGAADEDDDAWLRMMVPMNLRSSSDRLLSAANVVSSVFLDRRGPDFADPEALLRSIQDELQLIKDNKLGLTFIFSLRLFRLIPGGLKNNARQDKCTVSCIFTNIGRPLIRCSLPKQDGRLVAGNLVLEHIDGLAPLRPYNCATFSASHYAGRLTLTLHYDPRPVSPSQADDLLAGIAAQVRKTVG